MSFLQRQRRSYFPRSIATVPGFIHHLGIPRSLSKSNAISLFWNVLEQFHALRSYIPTSEARWTWMARLHQLELWSSTGVLFCCLFDVWSWEPSWHFLLCSKRIKTVASRKLSGDLWRSIHSLRQFFFLSLHFHQDSARGCDFDLSPDGGLALYPPGRESLQEPVDCGQKVEAWRSS